MGDRSYVELTVANEHKATILAVCSYERFSYSVLKHNVMMTVSFDDVNYGELSFLPNLVREGIAYNSRWGQGSSYGPGTEYARFTPEGELIRFTVHDNEINPPIDMLLELSKNPESLALYVQEYAKKSKPLPWDNQVEYGKIFRTKNLITSPNF